MDNQIIEIIGKLIAAFAMGIIAYLTPKIKEWLEVNTSNKSQQTLELLIKSFTQAAEQLLHNDDPDGSKRMEYVKNNLNALGIEVTKELVGMIEGAVWEINNKNKVAKNGNS